MKKLDLVGQIFGRLTVIAEHGKNSSGNVTWLCKCECGNLKVVSGGHLQKGSVVSCGCYLKEVLTKRNKTHCMSKDRLYVTWKNIRSRCNNPKNNRYDQYGGRGISVCERWDSSFENFVEDMGRDYQDSLTIERIDINGNYEKDNCIWIKPEKQARNKGKYRSNTSGTTGVRLSENKRWVAFWIDIDGNKRGASYSISKYGEELAKFLAEERRDIEIRRLNMLGAAYSPNHGK